MLLGMNFKSSKKGKVGGLRKPKVMQKLVGVGSLRPSDKPLISANDSILIDENIDHRNQSMGNQEDYFKGPNRPSAIPGKTNKVEVTYDPNNIPDLDDII